MVWETREVRQENFFRTNVAHLCTPYILHSMSLLVANAPPDNDDAPRPHSLSARRSVLLYNASGRHHRYNHRRRKSYRGFTQVPRPPFDELSQT